MQETGEAVKKDIGFEDVIKKPVKKVIQNLNEESKVEVVDWKS